MFGLFRKNKNKKNITEIALEEFTKGNYKKARRNLPKEIIKKPMRSDRKFLRETVQSP
jgi:hypothetical protein